MAFSTAVMQSLGAKTVTFGALGGHTAATRSSVAQSSVQPALPRAKSDFRQSSFSESSPHRAIRPAAHHGSNLRKVWVAPKQIGSGPFRSISAPEKSSFLGTPSAFAEQSTVPRGLSGGAARGGALTAEANLFSRIYRIFVASVTGVVKQQEDPSKLLDQAVIDMQEDLGKVKQATAAVVGAQRQLEQKYNGASQISKMWYDRARLALSKGEEDLARRALEMRKIEEDKAKSFKEQLDKQTMIANKLVANTKLLETKIKEAQGKKDSLKYRAEAAKATQSIQEMLGSIDTSKAIYAFEKLEEDVLRAEAKADALSDLVTSDMDAKFAALESDSAVEDDLQQLKDSMRSTRTLPAPKASDSEGRSVFWKEYVDPRVERELAELRGQMNPQ